MEKYQITFGMKGLDSVKIEADSIEEAKKKVENWGIKDIYEVWKENKDTPGYYDLVWSEDDIKSL